MTLMLFLTLISSGLLDFDCYLEWRFGLVEYIRHITATKRSSVWHLSQPLRMILVKLSRKMTPCSLTLGASCCMKPESPSQSAMLCQSATFWVVLRLCHATWMVTPHQQYPIHILIFATRGTEPVEYSQIPNLEVETDQSFFAWICSCGAWVGVYPEDSKTQLRSVKSEGNAQPQKQGEKLLQQGKGEQRQLRREDRRRFSGRDWESDVWLVPDIYYQVITDFMFINEILMKTIHKWVILVLMN